MVTIVEGINDVAIDINKLAKILKSSCAAGGTVKDRTIELQFLRYCSGILVSYSQSLSDRRTHRAPVTSFAFKGPVKVAKAPSPNDPKV